LDGCAVCTREKKECERDSRSKLPPAVGMKTKEKDVGDRDDGG